MTSLLMQKFLIALALCASSPVSAFRFATWNLRYDSKPDNITVAQSIAVIPNPLAPHPFYAVSGEQPWSTRRLYVTERVLSEGTALLSVQEALVRQVNDLVELLGNGWDYVGVGRNDGKTAGEYSAIFYRKDTFTLRSTDNFWLSNTPFEPSKFPGAGSIRICTVGKFTTSDGVNVTIMNTHLDDSSDEQRRLGGSMLLYRARYEAAVSGEPVLLSGDFNSPPTGTDSGAYEIVTGAIPPTSMNQSFVDKYAIPDGTPADFKMVDLQGQAPRLLVNRNFATYTSFAGVDNTASWSHIDFFLAGSTGGWSVTGYKVETALTDDGLLASDHRPVFVDVTV
ncbi:Endonuclease/exonuclease/phosphatase [Auriculariales sp. MPI-PUGE-AT-0066]|nr:Endonuclease/exonuclease/phosphatase [Auriculariales sp. MPI-PUGE-AT-0066]